MKKKKDRQPLKSAEIICFAPHAREVFVGGTFNSWDPGRTPMSKGFDGTWHAVLKLPTGSYEYKFVVDGSWICEPGIEEHDPKLDSPDYVPNVYGTMNHKLDV